MNELMKKLDVAYKVYKQANEHFIKARLLNREIEEREGKNKHTGIMVTAVIISIFIGLGIEIPILSYAPIVIVVGLIVAYKKKVGMENKAFAKEKQKLIDQENAAGQKILQDNAQVFSFLPINYVNYPAISSIRTIIQQGRAKTLPEALNLYDEQKHREDMKSAQREMQDLLYAQCVELQGLQYEVNELKRRS